MKSRILLSLLLVSIPITYAFADTVQINLTKKPDLSEEGIHLSTKQGDYSMYAVYASKKVFKAFEQAKKGQCLELETKKGFDFSDASEITNVKPCSTFSNPDFAQLERWKAEVKGQEYSADSFDKVIAETSTHFIVYQNAGVSCAAGNHWLFNIQLKSYRPVDSGTCDDRKFKTILEADKLIFMSGKKVTAQYPVY